MKNKLILSLLVTSLNIACNNEKSDLNIEFLKDSGYKNLSCKLYYNENLNTYDFIAKVVPKLEKIEMLLARCNDNTCTFESIEDHITPSQILCQRFYNNKDFTSEYDANQVLLSYNANYFLDIKE